MAQHAFVFPASFSQQRLWFLDRLKPGHAFYNMPAALRLSTPVDPGKLRLAFDDFVRRHESLRTCFAEVDGYPLQVVLPQASVPFEDVDLTDVPPSDRHNIAEQRIREESTRAFDLSQAPLLRVALLRFAKRDQILVVTLHHIIADGWAIDLLFREISALYEARASARRARLRKPRLQYADYALWQHRCLPSRDAERQYWRQKLADVPHVLALPTDWPRPAEQRFRGGLVPIEIPSTTTQALRRLAQAQDATLFMVLLAGFQALLHRYTSADHITVGSPIAGRHHDGLDTVVGLFVNTLVLGTRFDGNPTVTELIERVRETALEAYAHQDFPFEQLVAELAPQRSLGHQPLFQVLFGLQSISENGNSAQTSVGTTALQRRLSIDTGTSKCDLTLSLTEIGNSVSGFFEYDSDLFELTTIERLRGHLEILLAGMASFPQAPILSLPLLTDSEVYQITNEWNRTASPFPRSKPVHRLVEARAVAHPDVLAIIDGEVNMTYGEMEAHANGLARQLTLCGVRRGDRVGICLPRSAALVVAWLATLKAGAAYVPLDPEYPRERLSFIVENACVRAIITNAHTRARFNPGSAKVIDIDAEGGDAIAGASMALPDEGSGDDLAYILYTSGSTGIPKGVAVSHRAINRLVINTNYIKLDPSDRIGQVSSPSFDAATFEIWAPLVHGAQIVIVPREVALDPRSLTERLRRDRITVLFLTTALFNQIVADIPDAFKSLRCLMVGGEMANPGSFRDVLRYGAPKHFLHAYGPTETTTFATIHRVENVPEDATTIPIGRPIANTRVYVVDARMELVPIGVPGELVIAGDGVAQGYWDRPDLTAEKFIPERWSEEHGRAYRTGDLVRYRKDGLIEILGRIDDQVKIRGFRVEPGEVEALLARHPAVRGVAVVVRDVGREKRLVAYIVTCDDVPEAALRAWLKERVPEYLVPAAIVRLERLPLMANGKVDRARLPAMPLRGSTGKPTAPRTKDEQTLAEIWTDVLGLNEVSVHDNFFELGGDSILSIQMISRASRAGLRFTPQQLFQHQTIAELAPHTGRNPATAAEQEPVSGDVPLTPIQHWFFEQNLADPHHFNQALMLDLPIETDLHVLELAVQSLVLHHDALRLRYELTERGWRQWIALPGECSVVSDHDVSTLEANAQLRAVERIAAGLQGSLDLKCGPIIRVARFTLEPSHPSRLLILIHHLAVDLVSWRVLVEDLQTAVQQASQGEPIKLPAKTMSFKTWSERMLFTATSPETQEELRCWLKINPNPEAARLPADRPFEASANTVATARVVTVSLDPDDTQVLLNAARAYRAQVPEILVAGLLMALKGWAGDRAFTINVEGHGRDVLGNDLDVSRTVGWFTSIVPITFSLPSETTFIDALTGVKETFKELPRRGTAYQFLRYLFPDSATREQLGALDTAQIAFNYLGQFTSREEADQAAPLQGLDLCGPTRSLRGQRRHMFEIDSGVVSGRLVMHWTYSEALHDRRTIERIAADLIGELRCLLELELTGSANKHVTASDFPLAQMDDRELAIVRRACPGFEDVYPLSPLQQGMLFHSLYTPGSGQYVVQMSMSLAATLDIDRFRDAWQTVVARHAVLRSAFLCDALRQPMQIVSAQVQLPWDVQDWRTLPSEQIHGQLETYLARERTSGFDLSRAPLMRLALIRISDAAWRFIWTCHHLLIDGWSRPLVLEEIADTYDALGHGTPPARQPCRPYREYIQWLADQDATRAKRFWRETLDGFCAPTPIIAALPRAAQQPTEVGEFDSRQRVLSQDLTDRLQALGRREHLTLSTLVHGAWALLLSRYCGTEDVVFGATVSGRPAELEGVEQMIGPFINTLPVRAVIPNDLSMADWLRNLQAHLVDAREFEYSPLAEVQHWSDVPAGVPLFESLLVFENYPSPTSASQDANDARFVEWTNYPLTLAAIPGARLRLEISYSRQIAANAIDRMLNHLDHLLTEMSDNLDRPASMLSLLTADERRQLVVEWNETSTATLEETVPQLIALQAARTPDSAALLCGEKLLTYAQLVARARSLAAQLRRAGVTPGTTVGVLLPRSINLPVTLLAILEAGGAYVPLDPASPNERITFLARDARLCVLVSYLSLCSGRPDFGIPLLLIDENDTRDDDPELAETPSAGLNDTAYVVYTSGTTGEPKGVAVSHRSLANHAVGMAERYGLQSSDRVLQLASASFDVAAEEIFPTWVSGGAVVSWPESVAPSIAELVRFADDQRLTILNLPTPLWHEWVDDIDHGLSTVPTSVRSVIVGTDRVAPDRLARWRALVGDRVLWSNAYGCAEATITSTVFSLPNGNLHDGPSIDAVPIGRPISNTRVYVVDSRLDLLPVGIPGELVIAGDGVAIGYLHRPDLTAEKFIAEQWRQGGGRAYRTGDLVRYRPDGLLEMLGRMDDQVKIRGIRVEPGEVEALLASLPEVRDVVVLARDAGREGMREKRLIAYVVMDGDMSEATLRAWLLQRVPEYLVPASIVRMDRLPLSANGKVDRAALPVPKLRGRGEPTSPRTALETMLAGIWCEVLVVEEIGIHDNFFELGGHSLTATRVVSRIRQATGAELPLRAIFDAPTIAALAKRLDLVAAQPIASSISRRAGGGPCPLSFAQERLWFLDQMAPGTPLYNMPCSMRIEGHLDLAALEASLNEIIRRHESLRTTFAMIDGRPVQVVSPTVRIELQTIDLSKVPLTQRRVEARRWAAAEVRLPFDLQRGPLVRASILRLHDTEHVLLVTMHHIVSDGWSVGILLHELEVLYSAFSRGRPSPLPELAIQYGDYAQWQREWLDKDLLREQVAYWRERLSGMTLALDLPTDWPRPPQQTFRGAYDSHLLSKELTEAIQDLADREGVTLFMVILAVFQLLLSRLSGQEDITVGSPVAGRNRLETEPLIGFFLNNLVLRTDLSGDPTFRVLLGRVREIVLGAFAHQDLPFERLLAELDPPRDPSRTPLFQVFLNVLNTGDEQLNLPDSATENFTLHGARAADTRLHGSGTDVWSQFDMTLYVNECDGALQFLLVYNIDLFSELRIAELLDQLVTLLTQCVGKPDLRISSFSLVTSSASLVLPDPSVPLDDTWIGAIHHLFAAQARRTPERLAVRDSLESWSYAELDERSSQLGHRLRQEGVGVGDTVVIYANRSATLVWAVLSVLKVGAVFTILDPMYPAARLASIVDLARPRLLLRIEAAGKLPTAVLSAAAQEDGRCSVVSLPALAVARRENFLAEYPTTTLTVDIGPDSPACLGFTSGSTGIPKGIVGRHGSLTHFLPWLAETFELSCDDRFSMLSGLSHDPLQREIFTPLYLGSTICVPSNEDYDAGARLAGWVAREGITVAHLTPALGQLMGQATDGPEEPPRLDSLRLAFFVGDVLTSRDIDRLVTLAPHVTCVNYYGSTETQRAVGYFVPPRTDPANDRWTASMIPAGRGIRDVQLLVLGAADRLCGIGELGEIRVRSPHLALGYLGSPELTAERFTANPFTEHPHDRLYRSGDLGRYLPDGNVAFVGRRDLQVKIRGFRIELSEVEAIVAQHENVREVVAVAREEAPGDRRLVVYVVPRGAAPAPALLQDFVSKQLPSYMVPAHVVILPALPVTPNGKIDRQALPPPKRLAEDDSADMVPPSTVLQVEVAKIWQDVLQIGSVDLRQSFFEAGGHSLLSTQLMARVRKRFGVEIALAHFFRSPTIAGLAAAIEQAQLHNIAPRLPIEPAPRAEYRVRLGSDGAPILTVAMQTKLLSMMRGVNGR